MSIKSREKALQDAIPRKARELAANVMAHEESAPHLRRLAREMFRTLGRVIFTQYQAQIEPCNSWYAVGTM